MMKQIFTILLLLGFMQINAQQNITKFTGGEIYLYASDTKTGEQIFRKPYGKILSIEYDSFYKSYYILFQMENGATGFGLEYINEFKVPDGVSYRMKEKGKSIYYDVFDRLEKSGIMIIINREEIAGATMSYQIVNCKKE